MNSVTNFGEMIHMKVLTIIANLCIGGAEKVARDISLYSDPDKYEHHYIVFGDNIGAYEQQIIDHGGKVFHLPSPGKGYCAYFRTLCRLIKENRYHVVHAHNMFNCGLSMLAAKLMRVPVRIAHSHSALDDGNGLLKRIYEATMRALILSCATDLVACGEKAGIRLFGEKNYRKRAKLILNGIDIETFRFNEEKRNYIRGQLGWADSFLLGHTGHLATVKNQVYLLELMPYILKARPEARLLLLGEGADRSMLERKIRELNLTNYVQMPGNVQNVADYLSAMDVFVFPSLYEGMPLSILEVQANGLPCVLSTGVPKDVFLTDLLTPLSLEISPMVWTEIILSSRRAASDQYVNQLVDAGFDSRGAMNQIYQIYERNQL